MRHTTREVSHFTTTCRDCGLPRVLPEGSRDFPEFFEACRCFTISTNNNTTTNNTTTNMELQNHLEQPHIKFTAREVTPLSTPAPPHPHLNHYLIASYTSHPTPTHNAPPTFTIAHPPSHQPHLENTAKPEPSPPPPCSDCQWLRNDNDALRLALQKSEDNLAQTHSTIALLAQSNSNLSQSLLTLNRYFDSPILDKQTSPDNNATAPAPNSNFITPQYEQISQTSPTPSTAPMAPPFYTPRALTPPLPASPAQGPPSPSTTCSSTQPSTPVSPLTTHRGPNLREYLGKTISKTTPKQKLGLGKGKGGKSGFQCVLCGRFYTSNIIRHFETKHRNYLDGRNKGHFKYPRYFYFRTPFRLSRCPPESRPSPKDLEGVANVDLEFLKL